MFALWSSPNRIPVKYKGPIKKMSHLRAVHLRSPRLRILALDSSEVVRELFLY